MSFYADAICTLEALARAVHGYDDRSAWRDRHHRPPPCYHRQTAFDSKRFLSNRLKIRPCNKLIKLEISA